VPRKHFRKFLPSHESVRQHRFVACFGTGLHHHNLWHLHRRSVAGGLAVGLFAGLIPGPFQMLSAAILSILCRVNLPVAVVTTWYTNPVTIVPLYIVAYKLGTLLCGAPPGAMPDIAFAGKGLVDWIPALLAWMQAMGKPFALGLVALAVALPAGGYLLALLAWRTYVVLAWRRRSRTRAARLPRPS
jgi:uncharacterized protein (DUF2062 family)